MIPEPNGVCVVYEQGVKNTVALRKARYTLDV
jgi:hypothetical protein